MELSQGWKRAKYRCVEPQPRHSETLTKWQEGYSTLKVQFSKMSASSGSSGYQADLVGSLDASNPKEEVERLIAKTKVVPAVNQLEFHPWVTQLRLAVQKLMRLTYPAQ